MNRPGNLPGRLHINLPGVKARTTRMPAEPIDAHGTVSSMPSNWPKDSLARFLDDARHNMVASVANLPDEYRDLAEIDRLYCRIVDNLNRTSEPFPALFLIRTRSCLRAGVRLCLSGQVSETYMLLRGSLESALYGFYVKGDIGRQELWLRRHDDNDAKKRVREEFKILHLLNHLRAVDEKTASIAHRLYEDTIDYGGHPNERAINMSLNVKSSESRHEFRVSDFNCCDLMQLSTIKTTVRVGICSLDIFFHIFPERYKILQIDVALNKIRRRF